MGCRITPGKPVPGHLPYSPGSPSKPTTSVFNVNRQVKSVINLLFAAYTGDVTALRRLALSSMDMEQRDYDSRTALHVAAAEGHVGAVRFLLDACRVNPVPKDRWGNTPLDEALHFCHHDVVDVLRQCQDTCSPPAADDAQQPGGKSQGTF